VPDGGLAPVDPLQPGSDVAPVLIQKPSGVDEGNSFCMGQCYAKEEEAHCAKPYVSLFFLSWYLFYWRVGVAWLIVVLDRLRLCISRRMTVGCAASLLVISRRDNSEFGYSFFGMAFSFRVVLCGFLWLWELCLCKICRFMVSMRCWLYGWLLYTCVFCTGK